MNTLNLSNIKVSESIWAVLKVVMGVFLLFASSQISIPLEPVPINLGTVGVMTLGLLFNRHLATLSVMSFLMLGALGVPVFANFAFGIPILVGPRGGYLFGYLLAVFAMTSIKDYLRESFWHFFLLTMIGTICVYSLGVGWLAYLFGFEKALNVGLWPFVISGLVKATILALGINYIKPQILKKYFLK